jgi:hypothetical protein
MVVDLCLKLELSLFCCVNLLYVTYFGGSPSRETVKIGIVYKKLIYSSVKRGTYGPIFLG